MGWLNSLRKLFDDPETTRARQQMASDRRDARRRFVFGILAMSYEVDPGYLPSHSTTAVSDWYGIRGRDDLILRIHDYGNAVGPSDGYSGFLGAFLARAGEGAGMLSPEESWSLALGVARRVQQSFASWTEVGDAYLAGHLAYREAQGDSAERLDEIRYSVSKRIARHQGELWADTPFATPLA